jgi:hypothetical protein
VSRVSLHYLSPLGFSSRVLSLSLDSYAVELSTVEIYEYHTSALLRHDRRTTLPESGALKGVRDYYCAIRLGHVPWPSMIT